MKLLLYPPSTVLHLHPYPHPHVCLRPRYRSLKRSEGPPLTPEDTPLLYWLAILRGLQTYHGLLSFPRCSPETKRWLPTVDLLFRWGSTPEGHIFWSQVNRNEISDRFVYNSKYTILDVITEDLHEFAQILRRLNLFPERNFPICNP